MYARSMMPAHMSATASNGLTTKYAIRAKAIAKKSRVFKSFLIFIAVLFGVFIVFVRVYLVKHAVEPVQEHDVVAG